KRPFLAGVDIAEEKSACDSEPGRRAQIILVIDLRSLEQAASWADKSILVRIIQLSLVIVAYDQFVFPPIHWLPINVRPDQPAFSQKIIERFRIKNRVRIPGISKRISDQPADPQRRIRRPADIRDRAG